MTSHVRRIVCALPLLVSLAAAHGRPKLRAAVFDGVAALVIVVLVVTLDLLSLPLRIVHWRQYLVVDVCAVEGDVIAHGVGDGNCPDPYLPVG